MHRQKSWYPAERCSKTGIPTQIVVNIDIRLYDTGGGGDKKVVSGKNDHLLNHPRSYF